jgi:hypothetical protein
MQTSHSRAALTRWESTVWPTIPQIAGSTVVIRALPWVSESPVYGTSPAR